MMISMVKHPQDARARAWLEAARVGRHVQELLRPRGGKLVDVRPLSSLASPRMSRGSFRLGFSNGRMLKACLFESEFRCRQVGDLLAEVEPGIFPKAVFSHRPWLVVEWVEGRAVAPIKPRRETLKAIGRLQGVIHSVRQPICRHRNSGAGCGLDLVEKELEDLGIRGALSRRDCERLLLLAGQSAPESCSVGLVHGDLCGENLIVNSVGKPVAIDFETLSVDALDFDLARTWYRWPVSRRQREAYLEGYRQHRPTERFEEHFLFWAIRATVQSAVFRIRNETPGQDVPIAVLKRITRGADRPLDLLLSGVRGEPRSREVSQC